MKIVVFFKGYPSSSPDPTRHGTSQTTSRPYTFGIACAQSPFQKLASILRSWLTYRTILDVVAALLHTKLKMGNCLPALVLVSTGCSLAMVNGLQSWDG